MPERKAPDPLREIEKTQEELKANIEQSERLIDKTQDLLKKHRKQIERKVD